MIPDAANAIGHLFGLVPEGWLPDAVVDQMDELSPLADPERTERAVSLADTLVEDSILIPFATYGPTNFFSDRIGCQVASGSSPGLNLVALCLKD